MDSTAVAIEHVAKAIHSLDASIFILGILFLGFKTMGGPQSLTCNVHLPKDPNAR